MDKRKQLAATWTVFGTYICLVAVALLFAPSAHVFAQMKLFAMGGVAQMAKNPVLLTELVPSLLLIVAIELPVAVLLGLAVRRLLGKAENGVSGLYADLDDDQALFKSLFVLVLLEELFARWLFLGLLTRIPFLDGPVAFYALMLVGNGIWAALHLGNYKRSEDRHPLRVLSQFVGGLFLSFVYVRYGLMASILAHFAFNAVLFAGHKVQNVNVIDGLTMVMHGAYALVSGLLISKPLGDMAAWFDGSGRFALPGWGMTDYLAAAFFVSSCVALVFDVLLYDKNGIGTKKNSGDASPLAVAVILPIVLAIGLAIVYLTYWLVGLFVSDVPLRVLIAAIALTFFVKSRSGSAATRAFWEAVSMSYLSICIVEALGFAGALLYMLVSVVLSIPKLVLMRLDD